MYFISFFDFAEQICFAQHCISNILSLLVSCFFLLSSNATKVPTQLPSPSSLIRSTRHFPPFRAISLEPS
jgi:hypothetical protein